MAKVTDLYPILRAYAAKSNSPYIEIDIFLSFLERYAQRKVKEQPEWAKWLSNAGVQFWSELAALTESDKCVLLESASPGGEVYMPFFYTDMLEEIYRDPDKDADLPFPSEESLRITLPENQLNIINLRNDLKIFFRDTDSVKAEGEEEQESGPLSSKKIIKLIMPDDLPSVLILSNMIPARLLETALLKVRHYLRSRGNKEFALHKLAPQMQGKEKYLREIIDQIMIRPFDSLKAMESSGDFSYIFWMYFCSLVKSDISKRKETLSEDIAAAQAVNIIEICNSHFKSLAVKRREREIAFRNLELRMSKAPLYFTKEEILKFGTDKGVLLLGSYSHGELDAYIKRKTTESEKGELPDWFILQGNKNQLWYLKKEKYLFLCAKMLVDTRPLIKKAITKRWTKLLREYQSEPAMEKDPEFEKMLNFYTVEFNPTLISILKDQKLSWVYEETERLQGGIQASLRIFKAGELLPMSELYAFSRRVMLSDAKMLLPFWYSTPLLTSILSFFKKLFSRKKKKPVETETTDEISESKVKEAKELQVIAELIIGELVPKEKNLDDYLTEVETRWNRLLDVRSRQDLIDDIQSLARTNLRKMLRVHRSKKISRESLQETANLLITSTPALYKISSRDSLHLYIELYMLKLLHNIQVKAD